jgi:hypothetical protein
MLLHHGRSFLQVLEGDELILRRLFSRIERDPRHHQVSVVDASTLFGDRRSFGDWSMGFSALDNAQIVMGFIEADITEDLLTPDKAKAIYILKTAGQRSQHEPA